MLKKLPLKNLISIFFILFSMQIPLMAQSIYQAYFGNLHSHTSNSDGAGEPSDAFNFARDTAGLDFLAVTDHVEQIEEIIFISEEWSDTQDAANNATVDGSFVGFAGWEWGSPLDGHINVFNTSSIINDAGALWYYDDFPAFLNWLLSNTPAIAQFNHPGDVSTADNWNDFEYLNTITDTAFPLVEFQNVKQATDWYEYTLAKGWHLSPVWNQDNHSADWGTKDNGRAGIWSETLSRSSLVEAIIAGRTFATMDKNAKIWIDLGGVSMGSEMTIQETLPLHLSLSDADNESWISIEVVSKNGVLMDIGAHSGNLDTTVTLNLLNDEWVFVRAIQADSNYLWSAPVYVTGDITNISNINSEKTVQLFPNPAKEYFVINTGYENSIIKIYDIVGNPVYENTFQRSLKVNSQALDAGVYFVNITANKRKYSKKIVIAK